MSEEPAEPRRAHYIGAPEFFLLDQACMILWDAFGHAGGVYLVGSSLRKRDYRDVDIRAIINDAEFERLFPGAGDATWRHPLWSLVCSSISLHLARASGLKIDFQIQRQTDANRDFKGERNAIGIFYAATRPKT